MSAGLATPKSTNEPPQVDRVLLQKCGIDDPHFTRAMGAWQMAGLKTKLAALRMSRTRDDWCALLEGSDACFALVLSMEEAPDHARNLAVASSCRAAA